MYRLHAINWSHCYRMDFVIQTRTSYNHRIRAAVILMFIFSSSSWAHKRMTAATMRFKYECTMHGQSSLNKQTTADRRSDYFIMFIKWFDFDVKYQYFVIIASSSSQLAFHFHTQFSGFWLHALRIHLLQTKLLPNTVLSSNFFGILRQKDTCPFRLAFLLASAFWNCMSGSSAWRR